MAIIHSLKCIVPFSFAVPLLSLVFPQCHLLSLFVIHSITRCHSLSLVVPLIVTCCHSLSLVITRCYSLWFVVTCCTNRCHSLSLIVSFVVTRCNSLSLVVALMSLVVIRYPSLSHDVPLVCLFINDPFFQSLLSAQNVVVKNFR